MGQQRVEPVDVGGAGSPGLALGVGAVGALVMLLALNPLLVNLDGPFGNHARWGLVASFAVALVSGAIVGLAAAAVARRSLIRLAVLLAGLAALVVVAFPTQIDRHESFVPQPNERSSCLGLTFRHYPPGTFDAATEVYCVGFERPLPAG